jgi:hypothetical protein
VVRSPVVHTHVHSLWIMAWHFGTEGVEHTDARARGARRPGDGTTGEEPVAGTLTASVSADQPVLHNPSMICGVLPACRLDFATRDRR